MLASYNCNNSIAYDVEKPSLSNRYNNKLELISILITHQTLLMTLGVNDYLTCLFNRLALFSLEIVIKTPILLPFYLFTSLMKMRCIYIFN